MKPRLALDTNCLIDLEENRPDAVHLRKLIATWKEGRIDLAAIAVSASENQQIGVANESFERFELKLANVGLDGAHHLLPLSVWDFGYWDHTLWTSSEMAALASTIQGILFPGVPADPPTNPIENSKWRNQMCDVLVAWCCVYHEWGCLVRGDGNFHDHRAELATLGLREVLYPADAAAACGI
jgi:hypothetical protein